MLTYTTGDATDPPGDGLKIIAHICNDRGGWGRGFVVALSRRSTSPELAYRSWYREQVWEGDSFGLGQVQLVTFDRPDVLVANMVAQAGIRHDPAAQPAVHYSALEECLGKVARDARRTGASVHMPRIGCGLGGGSWSVVEPLIQKTLTTQGTEVFVYDLPSSS